MLNFDDFKAALALLKERQHTQAIQQIETINLRMQQWVENKQISIEFVPTKRYPADYLAKALPRPALELCMTGMGMHSSK